MLRLHPVIRLASALLIVAAVFFAASITNLVFVYTAVILSLMAARLLVEHLRFVGLVTAPLLIALLLVWGWVMDPVEIPPPITRVSHMHSFFGYESSPAGAHFSSCSYRWSSNRHV